MADAHLPGVERGLSAPSTFGGALAPGRRDRQQPGHAQVVQPSGMPEWLCA